MAKGGVKLDMTGLRRFSQRLHGQLNLSKPGPVTDMVKQWGARYLTFIRRRYVRYSRGGGDWKPLAPSTVRKRRGGRAMVLVDLGILLGALTIGQPGNLFKRIRGGIRVGFGGPSRHPKGGVSIADIAKFHDQGMGNNPKREIIAEPSAQVVKAMQGDMTRAITRLGRQSEKK